MQVQEVIKGINSSIVRFKPVGLVNCLLLALGLVVGCKPKSAAPTAGTAASTGGYFQTPFQGECQFIVQAIVSDLAEQMYYAANHRVPDEKSFSVVATEKARTSLDAPVYELQITLNSKQVNCEVAINGPIWSPRVYEGVAAQLAQAVSLGSSRSEREGDTRLLAKLKEGTPEIIERENQRVSAALENDFADPGLHEEAALLLGAFLLRDHSGKFFEIRSPLSRLTAHLALAQFLRGSQPAGINGQMAEAMMLTLAGAEAPALERLNGMDTNSVAVQSFARALRARNTGDYRALDRLNGLSHVESVEWFYAWANYVATPLVWPRLSDAQKRTIDFVRVANDMGYSVEIGHQLLEVSVPLELQEIASVYELSQARKLTPGNLVTVLNELPEGCFTRSGKETHVRVIGWGQWANFLQRHLCNAIQQNFQFLNYKWGVPDEAEKFASECNRSFGALRLYPFVRRLTCTDVESYHKSVDAGFKVTVTTPQLVPAECWNYICYKTSFAPLYAPNPNPHINEWHRHNPPPGTVYDLRPRLNHPSLIRRADAVARFEQLHAMAPYDCRIISFLLEHKYTNQPTYEQTAELFQSVLPYSITAMRTVADTIYDQPERYEKLMLEAAALDLTCYYTLGDYMVDHGKEDLAAKYIDQACAVDPDSIRIASFSIWRVRYYLKKGEVAKARSVADQGGEVYSARGLEAKAIFLETTSDYDAAFEWYAKIEERYEDSGPLVGFCERYKKLTGNNRFDGELNKRLGNIFPNGMEKVSLADFHGPPTDGVTLKGQTDQSRAAGLGFGDVIVAINGTRTHTFNQYTFIRDLEDRPDMDLIVWKENRYVEIKASPPNRKFGVDLGNYRAR